MKNINDMLLLQVFKKKKNVKLLWKFSGEICTSVFLYPSMVACSEKPFLKTNCKNKKKCNIFLPLKRLLWEKFNFARKMATNWNKNAHNQNENMHNEYFHWFFGIFRIVIYRIKVDIMKPKLNPHLFINYRSPSPAERFVFLLLLKWDV